MSVGLIGVAIGVSSRTDTTGVRGVLCDISANVSGLRLARWAFPMHELSIAMALVDLACDASDRLCASKIDALHVSIGPLCGVVEDALAFSFELAAAGTPAEGARLVVRKAPLRAFCDSCNEERTIPSPQHLRCPWCGAPTPDVRSGRELELVAMEIPDVPDRADSSERPEEKRFARS